jgi:LuxR family maltose regulon positive regulatory protein
VVRGSAAGDVAARVSTRTDSALPLGALRAHGELLELRAEDLRFTTAEADEFLNGRLGLDLCASDVRLLVSRTEGWPAGIYLAALSMANATDRHALVAAFDGVSAHVVDFLSGEVLVAHDPALQDFMIRTSILERLTAPLCDAVLDGTNSGESLHALGRSNLFLVRSTAVATGARCLSTASIYKALPKPLLKLRALP